MLITANGLMIPSGAQAAQQDHDSLHMVNLAAEKLRSLGFEPVYVSMRSEAVYYALPGFSGVLRLATHGRKAGKRLARKSDWKVSSSLTLNAKHTNWPEVDCKVNEAIGRYLLSHAPIALRAAAVGDLQQ